MIRDGVPISTNLSKKQRKRDPSFFPLFETVESANENSVFLYCQLDSWSLGHMAHGIGILTTSMSTNRFSSQLFACSTNISHEIEN